MCNQYFHNVQITELSPDTVYNYYIAADPSGTVQSQVFTFKTAVAVGSDTPYTVSVINDMGYENAAGTHYWLQQFLPQTEFVWHGGDISYSDNWYEGILPCLAGYPCFNGTTIDEPVSSGTQF